MKARMRIAPASLALAAGLAAAVYAADVRSFGARGDGAGNDTEAFVKAFAAGKDVYVPAGTYLVGAFEMPEGAWLHGVGNASRLVLTNLDSGVRVGTHGRVSDLSFTGRDTYTGTEGAAQEAAVLRLGASRFVGIERVRIEDFKGTGIHTDHAEDVRISQCDFEKLNVAILLVFSKRVSVTDNTVKTCLARGIQFWGNRQNTIQSEDLIFTGNHVQDGGAGAIWGSGARRVIVSGNIVDGCRDVGLDLEMCDDSVISGNTVRRPEVAGIALFFACNNVSITGNTVLNDRPFPPEAAEAGWWVRAGIWLTAPNREAFPNDRGHRNIAIVGNTIHCLGDLPRRAIWVGSEAKNVRIESNAISGGEIYYGGHHQVTPLMLETLRQPVSLDDRPTPDKPKF